MSDKRYLTGNMAVAWGLALCLGAIAAGPATADQTQASAAMSVSERVRTMCTPDALRLCPEHPLGSSEMRYCMEAKQRSISRDCQTALEDDGLVPRGYFAAQRR
jgi:hypothetical protein